MTVIEMTYEFQRLIETMDSDFETSEKINSETILTFLNWAYDRYFKERYLSGASNKENVLIVQKRSAELSKLIKTITPLSVTQNLTYSVMVNLAFPDDFIAYVRSDIYILRDFFPTMESPQWTPAMFVDYDEIDELLPTPTNIPIIDKPAIFINDEDTFTIITDGHTTVNYVSLTYVRKPKLLSIDVEDSFHTTECEILSTLHEEIVKSAVEMYISEYKFRLKQTKPVQK